MSFSPIALPGIGKAVANQTPCQRIRFGAIDAARRLRAGDVPIGVAPTHGDGYLYLFVQGHTPSAYSQLPGVMKNSSPWRNWKIQINTDWRPRQPNGADERCVVNETPAGSPTRSKWKSDGFAAALLPSATNYWTLAPSLFGTLHGLGGSVGKAVCSAIALPLLLKEGITLRGHQALAG